MSSKILLFLLTVLFSLNLLAQENEHTDEHEHHKNEIAMAISPVYFVKEKVFSYGLHLHYVRNITNSKFGIGAGYERVFDDHKHNTFGLVLAYLPIENLSFNVSPGFTIEDENPTAHFAIHLEAAYGFEINNFHIGPNLEFAYDPEDIHISLGLHIGYGF
jgi:hypothetical protein